jgi:Ca2+-binding EF-hand superfamily protein
MKTHLITAAISALLVSGSVLAGNYPDDSQMTDDAARMTTPDFNQLDSDKDGVISRNEATQSESLVEKWNDVDTNEDGQLNQAEFSAFEAKEMHNPANQPGSAPDEANPVDRAN